MVREIEIGEEPERAEGEGKHGRNDPLEEPRSEENSAVAAELFKRNSRLVFSF